MVFYASTKERLPENYEGLCRLTESISNGILKRRVPEPGHIAKVLGEDAVKTYYFMDALLHAIEYGRSRWVLDSARRDHKAIQRHSFDAATKPDYRFNDDRLPSGYFTTMRDKKGILVHDLGEEFGKTPLRALVVNDVIRYLFGEVTGTDANLLTSHTILLIDSLQERIKRELPTIDHENVYHLLVAERNNVQARQRSIFYHYTTVLKAVQDFRAFIRQEVSYMPQAEKESLVGIVTELAEGVEQQIRKKNILSSEDATKTLTENVDGIIGIMEKQAYLPVDISLVLPGDPEFLLTLKKTLYFASIKKISDSVYQAALAASQGEIVEGGGDYLSPMMQKITESIDTIAGMENRPIDSATSIFRKARIKLRSAVDLVNQVHQIEMPYQRLQRATDYLYRNLVASIEANLEYLRKAADERDTSWETERDAFTIMSSKIKDLEARMKEMNHLKPVDIRRRRLIASLPGILTLGLYKRNS